MNFLVRIVLASSKPTAKLFHAKTVHNRSPSAVLPTRREHDALGLPGGLALLVQNMLFAQLLGKQSLTQEIAAAVQEAPDLEWSGLHNN